MTSAISIYLPEIHEYNPQVLDNKYGEYYFDLFTKTH